MRRIFKGLLFSVIFAVLLGGIAASSAFAETGDNTITVEEMQQLREQFANADPNVALGSPGGSDAAYMNSWTENPWGCKGQTDYPHATNSTGPWVVNVHARTYCPGNLVMPYLWVETQLYKETWCIGSLCFGIEPWGEPASDSGYDVYRVEATSHGSCENGYYKGISAHWMLGLDDQVYYGYSSNRRHVNNCP